MSDLVSAKSVRSLTDLVTKGTTPTSIGRSFTSRGIRFIKVETIGPDGNYLLGKEAFIDATTHELLKRSQLRSDDILFSIAGALGRTTVVDTKWLPANTNQAFAIIRPSQRAGVSSRYLYWALKSHSIRSLIAEINAQAAQANLSLEQVRDLQIPIPSIANQERIAMALDDADRLVASLERLITKKQAIRQGMMQELLSGRSRLPGFTDPWIKGVISDVADQHRIGVDPRQHKEETFQHFSLPAFDNNQQPVVERGAAIDSGKFVVPPNAVMVSKLNPRIPRVWAPETIAMNAVASTEFIVMTVKGGFNRSFFKWLMKSSEVTSRLKLLATGTTGSHARVHPSQLASMQIVVPNSAEQQAIAQVLDDVEVEVDLLRLYVIKAHTVKQGMMQELLTGRTQLAAQEVLS